MRAVIVFLLISVSLSTTIAGPLVQMNNLYTTNIITNDLITFKKVEGAYQSYSTIVTSKPLQLNATTVLTVTILSASSTFVLGCGQKNPTLLSSIYFGQTSDTVGYFALSGQKYINNRGLNYGAPASTGDTVSIKVDLHPSAMNVQFFKNGNSMGVAFGGLEDWQTIYIGISLGEIGNTIKITGYSVNT